MKIVTILGARPQFIKASIVSKSLRKEKIKEVVVHTGQHFDYNMSGIFFDELGMPQPDYNLGISGGTHSEMTGRMMIEIEKVLIEEKPDLVLLYGDTNSTLAGALSAAKLGISIVHIEAGNRVGDRKNPEEINRIITDHLSTTLLCCVTSAFEFLKNENLSKKAYVVGDPMYDAFLLFSNKTLKEHKVFDIFNREYDFSLLKENSFYFLTCHRQENSTNDNLTQILLAMENLDKRVVYPVHPRNKSKIIKIDKKFHFNNIDFINPIGYFETIALENKCCKIITDSGGVQREAFFAKKQCITLLNFVCWPETMVNNCNQLCRIDKNEILNKLNEEAFFDIDYRPFGDGHAGDKIAKIIKEEFAK